MRPELVCHECEQYVHRLGTALIYACATVGIEHGKSTAQMAEEHIAAYHQRGHL